MTSAAFRVFPRGYCAGLLRGATAWGYWVGRLCGQVAGAMHAP